MLDAAETGRTLRSGSIRLVPIQVKGRSSRNLMVELNIFLMDCTTARKRWPIHK